MNLVTPAMRRPLTVVVAVIAVVLAALFALQRMPRDIFPSLNIPTLYVAQPFGGMDAEQMEGYLTYYYEYHFLYITGIEHVESKSIQGVSLIKLQFHPGTDMSQAMAETIGYVNRSRAFMPPGTVPPFVMRFDSGSVPVGNLVFSSDSLTVGELQDAALNRVRPLFATLPGVSAPPPFGGSARSIIIRADPNRLRACNLSPDDVVRAIASANTITPAGNVRIGDMIPTVPMNAVVKNVKELENVAIRSGYPAIFVRDIGKVEDASDIQTGYALINGRRTVYIPVTKRADASTLSVVNLVKENLPKFQAAMPTGANVSYEFDQSPYVTRAIRGLVLEGALGAVLAGLMVLLFLRDWRSVTIVVLTIPLSVLAAALLLWLTKQTINLMTLGGLALAIGILVDMATVTIENLHTHLAAGKPIALAAADSAAEVALPLLVSMLCVLAVFVPSFFMQGAARALFVPLSLAVGFSLAAAYLFSGTLVPVLSTWTIRAHESSPHSRSDGETATLKGFARFQSAYAGFTKRLVGFRWLMVLVSLALAAGAIWFVGNRLGTEIFPNVDVGQFQLRLRAPTGTRIERTEVIANNVLDAIKAEVGAMNVALTLGFVGVQPPSYPINTIYLWTGGPEEAVLQVQLKRGTRFPIERLKERLRQKLAAAMPEVKFSFEPSDIVSRVMSLGSPTPIEVAVNGPSLAANREHAEKLRAALSGIPSLRDLQYQQALDYPTIEVNVNRERAGMMGVTVGDVARSVVAATSSSRFTTPIYWADPNSGVAYQVQVELPQARMNSVEEMKNIPVAFKSSDSLLLRSVAEVQKNTGIGQFDRYNMQRQVSLGANVVGEDLGSATKRITQAIEKVGAPPPRVAVNVRGQIAPLRQMLNGLQTGLLLTIVVIFLLLAANFQSLKLSFIVVSTVPAVIAGVALALWLTQTTLNLQSFMGAIMAVGVAVANAILLVTFAERSRMSGVSASAAAVEGAQGRLRPILMTSLAMIAGMTPMALGLGEGGEQTAPLGRAVVGGLAAATVATLFVLPCVFAIVQARSHRRAASLDPRDPDSSRFVLPMPQPKTEP
jgi:multidrug efflux pump subunit AcrB